VGNYAEATAYWQQSLPISQEIGDRPAEASALSNLGEAARSQGDYAQAKAYYEQRLRICRETGELYGKCIALVNLSLVSHNLGDDKIALEYGQQALQLTQNIGVRTHQGYALTNLGHAMEGLGRLPEAADAYGRAATLRRELGEHHMAMESTAGLARVCLAQGDSAQAQTWIEEILSYLDSGNTLDGTDEPLRIYHTCYCVLRANQDPRARAILQTAHQMVQERAAKISDEALRRSFLENERTNRELIAAWQTK
jgi:tetratricopeptide (TPR) repeat protein